MSETVQGPKQGTMRDAVNPALDESEAPVATDEELERNGHTEDEALEGPDDDDDDDDDGEEILDEHEPDVVVKVREGGVVIEYTVKEMGKGKMTEWMKIWSKRLKKEKVPESDEEFDKFLLAMICRCVWGPDGKLVPYSKAKSWGHRLKFTMFAKAQAVNGLTDKAVKREGKG